MWVKGKQALILYEKKHRQGSVLVKRFTESGDGGALVGFKPTREQIIPSSFMIVLNMRAGGILRS